MSSHENKFENVSPPPYTASLGQGLPEQPFSHLASPPVDPPPAYVFPADESHQQAQEQAQFWDHLIDSLIKAKAKNLLTTTKAALEGNTLLEDTKRKLFYYCSVEYYADSNDILTALINEKGRKIETLVYALECAVKLEKGEMIQILSAARFAEQNLQNLWNDCIKKANHDLLRLVVQKASFRPSPPPPPPSDFCLSSVPPLPSAPLLDLEDKKVDFLPQSMPIVKPSPSFSYPVLPEFQSSFNNDLLFNLPKLLQENLLLPQTKWMLYCLSIHNDLTQTLENLMTEGVNGDFGWIAKEAFTYAIFVGKTSTAQKLLEKLLSREVLSDEVKIQLFHFVIGYIDESNDKDLPEKMSLLGKFIESRNVNVSKEALVYAAKAGKVRTVEFLSDIQFNDKNRDEPWKVSIREANKELLYFFISNRPSVGEPLLESKTVQPFSNLKKLVEKQWLFDDTKLELFQLAISKNAIDIVEILKNSCEIAVVKDALTFSAKEVKIAIFKCLRNVSFGHLEYQKAWQKNIKECSDILLQSIMQKNITQLDANSLQELEALLCGDHLSDVSKSNLFYFIVNHIDESSDESFAANVSLMEKLSALTNVDTLKNALTYAASAGKIKAVELLSDLLNDHQSDNNRESRKISIQNANETLLHFFIFNRPAGEPQPESKTVQPFNGLKKLVEKGWLLDNTKLELFQLAISKDAIDIIEILKDKCQKTILEQALDLAAKEGKIAIFKSLANVTFAKPGYQEAWKTFVKNCSDCLFKNIRDITPVNANIFQESKALLHGDYLSSGAKLKLFHLVIASNADNADVIDIVKELTKDSKIDILKDLSKEDQQKLFPLAVKNNQIDIIKNLSSTLDWDILREILLSAATSGKAEIVECILLSTATRHDKSVLWREVIEQANDILFRCFMPKIFEPDNQALPDSKNDFPFNLKNLPILLQNNFLSNQTKLAIFHFFINKEGEDSGQIETLKILGSSSEVSVLEQALVCAAKIGKATVMENIISAGIVLGLNKKFIQRLDNTIIQMANDTLFDFYMHNGGNDPGKRLLESKPFNNLNKLVETEQLSDNTKSKLFQLAISKDSVNVIQKLKYNCKLPTLIAGLKLAAEEGRVKIFGYLREDNFLAIHKKDEKQSAVSEDKACIMKEPERDTSNLSVSMLPIPENTSGVLTGLQASRLASREKREVGKAAPFKYSEHSFFAIHEKKEWQKAIEEAANILLDIMDLNNNQIDPDMLDEVIKLWESDYLSKENHLKLLSFVIANNQYVPVENKTRVLRLFNALVDFDDNDIVEELLQRENLRNSPDWATLLQLAAKKGRYKMVTLLLKHNPAMANGRNEMGLTPLLSAIEHGHLNVVAALLEYKADTHCALEPNLKSGHFGANSCVNSKIKLGDTPFYTAVRLGHKNIVELLFPKLESEIDNFNMDGTTPLLSAAIGGHTEVIDFLLKKGADATKGLMRNVIVGTPPNTIIHARGDTLLHIVSRLGNDDIVKKLAGSKLLQYKKNPNATPASFILNSRAKTALDLVPKRSNYIELKLLACLEGAIGKLNKASVSFVSSLSGKKNAASQQKDAVLALMEVYFDKKDPVCLEQYEGAFKGDNLQSVYEELLRDIRAKSVEDAARVADEVNEVKMKFCSPFIS